jgi:hypothetical protein
MAFTDQEKARIKHHLGYPDWSALSASIQLGFPAGSQPLFLVEQAFPRLTVGGEDSVRLDLCQCEAVENQLGEARGRFKAKRMGELQLNDMEPAQLREELVYWQQKLADDLGVVRNPYSQSAYEGIPGGINAKVVG